MATLILSAAGLALGGSLGGSVLGLSTAVIGRAAGATLGRVIDQRLMGAGSEPVTTGRVDRFRLTGASEGAPVQQVYGRMRVGGQVIWATRFGESVTRSGGGKGTSRPATDSYSYTLSLAIALCEGEIASVGRIWADGVEISPQDANMRVYPGSEDQMPDPKIEAVEGAGNAPAYRGVAYVVFEDLALAPYGNRVPQFSFEVTRPSAPGLPQDEADLARLVPGVALVPGTGEYTLATKPVYQTRDLGETLPVNINTPSAQPDILSSLDALSEEMPACGSVSLVVSWFGGDLRCGECQIAPKVEQTGADADDMPWQVSGIARAAAQTVPFKEGRPVYGGTPTDQSVVQAIAELAARGQSTVFYPFILMEQLAGNGLTDPWSGAADQPALPWRGRITLAAAPGQAGSADHTAAAEAEVAAFFGTAAPGDFSTSGDTVTYTGPAEFSYRRFILHYAHLCALAGGVDAFCIGSEMRGLTQIRGAGDSFPAVDALRQLAADVRGILGPACKIDYAADWSEYHGYQPVGTGDKIFHLDALWADPVIDFIGIDNYMPLSDWRDGRDHADAGWESIYNLDYLRANIEGGEGYDWYYHSPEARAAQIRTPIADFWGEDWVWRYKDIRGWWENYHHNRIGGARDPQPTTWEPGSKPIWFTEIGCAAVDKATNSPNTFIDPKSSESLLPHFSNGQGDPLIQYQYLRALIGYYLDPAHNPVATTSGVQMIDTARIHVWAWDARPYPQFPGREDLWSDGANYARGHWISGRNAARSLASVVAEICRRSGLDAVDVSRLFGLVRGYGVADVDSARAALQPLMLAYGFDVIEEGGVLHFRNRGLRPALSVDPAHVVFKDEDTPTIEVTRAPAAELAGRVRLTHISADGDFEAAATEAALADDATFAVAQNEFPLVLSRGEARRIAERWLAESRLARETLRLTLPPSRGDVGAGDVIILDGDTTRSYRVDRVEVTESREIEAVRTEDTLYTAPLPEEAPVSPRPFVLPVPAEGYFLDLPLLQGDETPHAPYFAPLATPWPGGVALYAAPQDYDYALNMIAGQAASVGLTETALAAAQPGVLDRGPALRLRMLNGTLDAANEDDLLGGANAAVIGDPQSGNWEVFQFASAVLVAPDTYEVSLRLRGQAGTDATMPAVWPAGSHVILLNGAPTQIDLPSSARGVTRHFRWGPAGRPMDHASYRYGTAAFAGNGLRPYRVCHLGVAKDAAGDHQIGWTRRTRVDGDSWDGIDVPLGEQSEQYLVRITTNGTLRREEILTAPVFAYPAGQRATDGVTGDYRVEVAQISTVFGSGPMAGIDVVV